jgi:hypothetical protein
MMHRSLCLAMFFLLACGGGRTAQNARNAADEDDEDEIVDEEPEDETDEEESFVDEAALRGDPVELGDATEVPGTGVRLRPPAGSEAMPFGAGFLSMEERIQVSIVVIEGEEDLIDAVRTGGRPDAPDPVHDEEIEIAGQTARLGRDRIPTPNGELERTWLLAHDGQRGLAVVATYEGGRTEQIWPALRESFTHVEWDRSAQLDPARALGLEVDAIEGLTPSRATTANLVLLGRGATFPPEPGQPVVTISPLPMQLASEQTDRVCAQLVSRLIPVEEDSVEHEGAIEDGELSGCERLATAEIEGRRMATYAALLFSGGTPILVTGSVDAAQLRRWRTRFASAARRIRARS